MNLWLFCSCDNYEYMMGIYINFVQYVIHSVITFKKYDFWLITYAMGQMVYYHFCLLPFFLELKIPESHKTMKILNNDSYMNKTPNYSIW